MCGKRMHGQMDLLALCWISGLLTACSTHPMTRDSESIFEFGNVKSGQHVVHVFELFNSSQEELRVKGVSASCGCTVAKPSSIVIRGSSTITIEVDLDTLGKSGKTSASVAVSLSDGTVREFDLRGYVYNNVLPVFDFGPITNSGTVVRTLDFPWPAGADFRIEDIRYDKEIGEADLQNYSMERMSTVSLKPASTLGYGTFTSTVEIVTNDREQLIYTLPVKGYVECPIEIVSDRLAAGLIERNKKTTVTAEFRSPYGNPISVSKVEYVKGTASSWRLLEERNGIYPLEFELVPPDDPKSKVSIALLRVEVSAGTYKRTFEIEAMGIIN